MENPPKFYFVIMRRAIKFILNLILKIQYKFSISEISFPEKFGLRADGGCLDTKRR